MIKDLNAPNILMVAARYYPYIGGIETHVHEVGRRLVNSGVNITILTTMPYPSSTPLRKVEMVEGMRIIRVRAWPQDRDYYIAPEIYSIIERGKWDLIHCQGCHTFVPPIAMLAAKKARIPYVVTFHSGGNSSRLRTRLRGVQWKLLRPLLANASKLIGVSRHEADYFRNRLSLPAQQFTVIPNGATLPDCTHLTSKKSTQTLIVSVGRLERFKGHQHLITALPKIRERCPNAHLLILGVGSYEANLRDLAQKVGVVEHVEIRSIPTSDRQAMVEILSQASLVALLSEHEGHPIAVLEALSLQRPVLVANAPGLRELAEEGLVRAVSLNSSPGEIAAAALQQVEDPLVPAQFVLPTWDDCTRQLQEVYSVSIERVQCAS